jgi:transposase
METMIERCCGIDVHKLTIVACLLVGPPGKKPAATIKSFSTMTDGLLACRDWLVSEGCTHVVMESTGVYWKPVFNILEDALEVILAHARKVKHVPGKKTDIQDCQWLADLLRHGLITGSFIPPKPIRELRDLTRYRQKLIQQRSSEVNRLQKFLEDANIKLTSVVTDIQGVSAQQMIRHLIQDDLTVPEMAQLAKGRLRNKLASLEQALKGYLSDHHRLLLKLNLQMIAFYDENIETLNREIDQRLEPHRGIVERLAAIPGVKKKTIESLIAEIGVDMSRFPTHGHLAAWAGVCPGNNQSAGKRKSGRTPPGNTWLKCILAEAALAAAKKKDSYLKDRFHRLAARRGKKRAILAVAHSILIIAYHVIKEQSTYIELGATYFDRLHEAHLVARLQRRMEALGYKVALEKLLDAA